MSLLEKVKSHTTNDPHGRRIRGKKRVTVGRSTIAKQIGLRPNGPKELHGKQPIRTGLKSKVPMRRRGKRINGPQHLGRKAIGASQDKMARKEVGLKHPKVVRGINVTTNTPKIRITKTNRLSTLLHG